MKRSFSVSTLTQAVQRHCHWSRLRLLSKDAGKGRGSAPNTLPAGASIYVSLPSPLSDSSWYAQVSSLQSESFFPTRPGEGVSDACNLNAPCIADDRELACR